MKRVGAKSGMCSPLSQMFTNDGKKNLLPCCKICQTFLTMLFSMLNIAKSPMVFCVFGFPFHFIFKVGMLHMFVWFHLLQKDSSIENLYLIALLCLILVSF